MCRAWTILLILSLWPSETTYADDCTERVAQLNRELNEKLELPPTLSKKITKLAALHEGKVRLAFEYEVTPHGLLPMMKYLDFEEAWNQAKDDNKLHAVSFLLKQFPDLKALIIASKKNWYREWEMFRGRLNPPLDVLPYKKWHKLVPESILARGQASWFLPLHRTHIMSGNPIIVDSIQSQAEIFERVEMVWDSDRVEFRPKNSIRGFEQPLRDLLGLGQVFDLPLLDKTRVYSPRRWPATFHLQFSFPGYESLTVKETEWRLTRLNIFWLLRLLHVNPHLVHAITQRSSTYNETFFKHELWDRGIVRFYSKNINRFEIRVHFASVLDEIKEAISWMTMPHEEFEPALKVAAQNLLKRDPSITLRLQMQTNKGRPRNRKMARYRKEKVVSNLQKWGWIKN